MLKVEVNVAGVRHEFAQHVCKVQGAFNSAAGIVPGTSRVIEHFADGLAFILHFAGKPNCDDPFRHVSLNAQLPGRVAVVGPEAWHPIRSDLARSYRGQRCSSWLLVGRGLCGPDECLRPSASLSAISGVARMCLHHVANGQPYGPNRQAGKPFGHPRESHCWACSTGQTPMRGPGLGIEGRCW
jgi:hypothetical protein